MPAGLAGGAGGAGRRRRFGSVHRPREDLRCSGHRGRSCGWHHRDQRLRDWRHRPARRRLLRRQSRREVRILRRWRRDTHTERVVRVVQVERISRRRNEFSVLVAPPGAEEERPLQSRIGDVENGEQVDVVAPCDPVGEGRAVRERGGKPKPNRQIGSDVGERLDRRLEVLEVGHQIVTGVIDQTGGGIAQLPELLQCGRQPGPLPDQHIQGWRNVRERAVDHIALLCECPGDPPQLLNSGDDVVPLLVKNADDVVEAGEQLADLRFTSGQRDIGVVDDVTDLPQTASVGDHRQRRQCLLRGRIGRRPVQADGGTGLQSAAWLLAERRVERQVHRAQQAGLPDRGHRIGGHHHVRLDRDLERAYAMKQQRPRPYDPDRPGPPDPTSGGV